MPVYSFADGDLFVWIGAAQPADPIAFVESAQVVTSEEYANPRNVNGAYRFHLIGKRVNATILIPAASELAQIDALAGGGEHPVHIHVRESDSGISAGVICHSGRLASITRQGAEGGINRRSYQYIGNIWSAYG